MISDTKTSAGIYIGASSAELLVARVSPERTLEPEGEYSAMTRLSGELTEKNTFSPEGLERCRQVLTEFRKIALQSGAEEIRAAFANTLSSAANKASLMNICRDVLGTYPRMLSGKDEARLIYAGTVQPEYATSPVIAVYNASYSTPAVFGIGEKPEEVFDIPFGVGDLIQRFHTDRESFGFFAARAIREVCDDAFADFRDAVKKWRNVHKTFPSLFLSGPFPVLFAKMVCRNFEGAAGEMSSPIPVSRLAAFTKEVLAMSPEKRNKLLGMDPEIAPFVPACAVLMTACAEASGCANLSVVPCPFCIGLLKLP